MTFSLLQHIEHAIVENSIPMVRLEERDVSRICSYLFKQYFENYEQTERSGISRGDTWKYAHRLPLNLPIVLLVPLDFVLKGNNEDFLAWELHSTSDLRVLIEETNDFEFYLTNLAMDYLVHYEDHGVLLGMGRAKEWVEQVRKVDEV